MCHDINPLGTTFHLKELDRRALALRKASNPDPDRGRSFRMHSDLTSALLTIIAFFRNHAGSPI